jgi:hypothetical protein
MEGSETWVGGRERRTKELGVHAQKKGRVDFFFAEQSGPQSTSLVICTIKWLQRLDSKTLFLVLPTSSASRGPPDF